MFQIDTASAVSSMPTLKSPGTPGWWQNGNPQTLTAPTIPDEDWFNIVQAELCNAVTMSGFALNKTNLTQLYQAINSVSVNLASPGHLAFRNGLILNWGTTQMASGAHLVTVTFDQPFTVGPFAAFANVQTAAAYSVGANGNFTTTTMEIGTFSSTGEQNQSSDVGIYWLAIGT